MKERPKRKRRKTTRILMQEKNCLETSTTIHYMAIRCREYLWNCFFVGKYICDVERRDRGPRGKIKTGIGKGEEE
jgi:hypothetical protein